MLYPPLDYDDGRLPDNQPVIQTRNVTRFFRWMNVLELSGDSYPMIALALGKSGFGKTVTSQAYMDSLPSLAHNGLPRGIKIVVKPRSTGRALAVDILKHLGETPRRTNVYELGDDAADAIKDNMLAFLMFDEADRFNEDSFESLRHIFDSAKVPIVLVGLPKILRVINLHTKFNSRVGLYYKYEALTRAEVLDVVLPGLVFPYWQYDTTSGNDKALGRLIYKKTGPSFRKLRMLVQLASMLVATTSNGLETAKITPEIIQEASNWMDAEERYERQNDREDKELDEGQEPGPQSDTREQQSEQRYRANREGWGHR